MLKLNFSLLIFTFIVFSTACVNTKKFVYFNDLEKANSTSRITNAEPVTIERGDILQIIITTIDKEISQILNPTTSLTTGTSNSLAQGYLVDTAGMVEIPLVGKIIVVGKTTTELNSIIKNAVSNTVKNVFVTTRLLNFRISILGDVSKAGTYNITNERISILEALSLAGDVNIGAKRDDVVLIREDNGNRKYITLDLNSSKIFSSPYYYLKSKDIIYVKPSPSRLFTSTTGFQILPTIFGALSLLLGIYVTVKQ